MRRRCRAWSNLLKNAVHADGVDCRGDARREEALASDADGNRDAKSAALVVEVENQGREISPERLQAIFEKFYREDGARSTQGGGAGLGLAIAREIARAHGGELTARSVEGRTTFTLRIPA
ncbi:MAG: ATP-binding protein [Eggerthellaceae bacterium]